MLIKKVVLKGVGVFNDHLIQFSDGKINVIVSENETGKSTLCNAIAAIVYGFPSKSEADLRRSWDYNGEYKGRLEIDLNGSLISIERNFENNNVRMTKITAEKEEALFIGDANPKGRTEEPRAYRKFLDDLGFPPETIFLSAIYVGQLDVEIEIDDELRQHLSGAGKADYLNALNDLVKQYYSLTRQGLPGDNPKRSDKKLEEMLAKKDQLIEELRNAQLQGAELVKTENRLEDERRVYQENINKKNKIESEKSALDEYLNLLIERDSLNQRIKLEEEKKKQREDLVRTISDLERQLIGEKFSIYNSLSESSLQDLEKYVQSDAEDISREIQKIQSEENQLNSELNDPRFAGFSDIHEDIGGVIKELSDEKRNIAELEKRSTNFAESLKTKPPRWLLFLALVFMGLIGAGLGVTAILLIINNHSIGIALGLFIFGAFTGVAATVLFIIQSNRIQKEKEKQFELKTQLEEKQNTYNELLRRIKPILQRADENSIVFEALGEKWEQYKQKRTLLTKLIERKEVLSPRALLNIRTNPEIRPILDSASAAIIREQVKEFRSLKTRLETNKDNLGKISNLHDSSNTDKPPQDRFREIVILMDQLTKNYPNLIVYKEDKNTCLIQQNRLMGEINQLSTEIKNIDSNIRNLEIRLGQLRISEVRDLQLVQEEIQDTEDAIRRLQDRTSALSVGIEVLKDAIKEYEENHISRLSKIVSTNFSKFTHGNYKRVEIMPGDYPKIYTKKERCIEPSQLSAGAKDQLFFAIRLAISDILSSEMPLPLILDETFVNYDQRRLDLVHDTLNTLVTTKQIILLSHDSSYKSWADTLINYSSPSNS